LLHNKCHVCVFVTSFLCTLAQINDDDDDDESMSTPDRGRRLGGMGMAASVYWYVDLEGHDGLCHKAFQHETHPREQ
jgi:hypothetical protein